MNTKDRMNRALEQAKRFGERLEQAEDEYLGTVQVYTTNSQVLGENPKETLEAAADYKAYCAKHHAIWEATAKELARQVREAEEKGTASWM